MGLITMGYGHLTIITMGLGNSIRIVRQKRRVQFGVVEFQDVATGVVSRDILAEVDIEVAEQPRVEDRDLETEVRYD